MFMHVPRFLPIVLALAAACASGTAPGQSQHTAPTAVAASPTPTRDAGKDSLPLQAVINGGGSRSAFVGGDDHIGFVIENRGRDIRELMIDIGPWLEQHEIGMGSSRFCDVDPATNTIDCGPVYSGQTVNVSIHAFPDQVGDFHYTAHFYDREDGRLVPILGMDGGPAIVQLEEVVDPQTNQVPGYVPTPRPS
jgi:hypothetical protein